MTNREYHADGLEFAFKVFTDLTSDKAPKHAAEMVTNTMITNALEHIRTAAVFLRDEQRAMNVLIGSDIEDRG